VSPDELAMQRHNRVRELILRAACTRYPQSLDSEELRANLADRGYPMRTRDLDFYLAYLKEREYLRLEKKPQYEITLITITARGIDALDRRIDDCAIGSGPSVGFGETH
jgi:repressor of nif and glnA expression